MSGISIENAMPFKTFLLNLYIRARQKILPGYCHSATLRRELELMATNLIGETVILFLRDPAVKDYSGQAYRDSRGTRIIDVSPAMASASPSNFYLIVLHEVGHHIQHVLFEEKRLPVVEDRHKSEGAFWKLCLEKLTEYEGDPQEIEANHFMREMDRIAKQKAFDLYHNTEIETRIRVLKNITMQR
jgi:hypothetical protein